MEQYQKAVKYAIVIIAFLGLSATLNGQISLDEAIKSAEKNYPQIVQYGISDLSAEYKISAINSTYLPQISLSAKASYQSDVTQIPVSIPGFPISAMDKDQYAAQLQIDQIIWDGGAGRAGKSVAKADNLAEKKKIESDIYLVRERVIQVFFGILLIDENLKLINITRSDLERVAEKVHSLKLSGMATESDVNLVKVEILNLSQKESELIGNRKAFVKMLSLLMGKELDYDESLLVPSKVIVPQNSFNSRPEIDAFNSMVESTRQKKELVDARNNPRIGLYIQGGYGKPGLNMLKNEFDPFLTGGIRLSWNFGGLYTRKSDLSQLELQEKIILSNKELFLFNLNLKTSQQFENLVKLEDITNKDQDIILLRESIRSSAEAKLKNGTITVNDLLGEILKLDLAKRNASVHNMEYLSALYEYKFSLNN